MMASKASSRSLELQKQLDITRAELNGVKKRNALLQNKGKSAGSVSAPVHKPVFVAPKAEPKKKVTWGNDHSRPFQAHEPSAALSENEMPSPLDFARKINELSKEVEHAKIDAVHVQEALDVAQQQAEAEADLAERYRALLLMKQHDVVEYESKPRVIERPPIPQELSSQEPLEQAHEYEIDVDDQDQDQIDGQEHSSPSGTMRYALATSPSSPPAPSPLPKRPTKVHESMATQGAPLEAKVQLPPVCNQPSPIKDESNDLEVQKAQLAVKQAQLEVAKITVENEKLKSQLGEASGISASDYEGLLSRLDESTTAHEQLVAQLEETRAQRDALIAAKDKMMAALTYENKQRLLYEAEVKRSQIAISTLKKELDTSRSALGRINSRNTDLYSTIEKAHHSLQSIWLGTERLTYLGSLARPSPGTSSTNPGSSVLDVQVKILISEIKKLKEEVTACYEAKDSQATEQETKLQESVSPGAWADDQIDQLHTVINTLTTENLQWEQRYLALQRSAEDVSRKLSDITEERSRLVDTSRRADAVKANFNQMQQEVVNLKAELAHWRKVASARDQRAREIEQEMTLVKQENDALHEEISCLQTDLASANVQLVQDSWSSSGSHSSGSKKEQKAQHDESLFVLSRNSRDDKNALDLVPADLLPQEDENQDERTIQSRYQEPLPRTSPPVRKEQDILANDQPIDPEEFEVSALS